MTIERISFQSIPVDEQDRALAFYRDVLGLTVHTDAPYEPDGWRWIFLSFPGHDTRLQFTRRDAGAKRDTPILALVSDDVDADCARWREQGVAITAGPDDAPWAKGIRWALIKDSEDNIVFVESLKREGQE
jgi:predicted enzyme related to lactoylglutathione lyase